MNGYNGGGYPPYDDNRTPSVQQPYVNRESFGETQNYVPQGMAHEYSYQPAGKKGSAGKKILTAFVAVLGVSAIAVTSIVGYRIVTDRDGVFPAGRNNAAGKEVADTETVDPSAASINRSNLPTLEQLAAPDDAMKIPDIISKMTPSVVGISCITNQGIATGSGIILSEDGYIITNAHVIKDAQSISVVLPPYYGDGDENQDELTYTAVNIGKDTQTDLAVLKIEKNDLVKAEIGKSSDVQVGELAIVIGNPLGLDLANTATSGIISAKDRTITVEDITMKVFQTDASINGGNSGGALINAYGQVVGITSAKVASAEVEGLGFAIPIDDALPIVSDLMSYGYVTGRPSLGITGADVKSAYSTYYGIPQGFLVKTVTEGSGAQAAGLKENDIIIAIDDTIINGIVQLNDVKNKHKPGDTVTLTVYRSSRKINIDVVLDEATGETAVTENNDTRRGNDYYNNYNDYDDYYYDPFSFFGGF